MSRIRRLTTGSALVALLLHPWISAAQDLPPRPPPPQPPPAAAGEEATKPSGAFFPTLGHNLVDDLKHIPRLNTVYWLAAGTGLALAVHPYDDDINESLTDYSGNFFVAGKVIGSTPFILGSAFTAYGLGRWKKHPRLEHLGMDEIEGALLTEGIVEAGKQIVISGETDRDDCAGLDNTAFAFADNSDTVQASASIDVRCPLLGTHDRVLQREREPARLRCS